MREDVLDGDWDPSAYWSTSNVGEAVPGVLTPLNWSLWKHAGEAGLRAALAATGALERSQRAIPSEDGDRILGLFHGRLAASVDFMGRMGDRLPATSGAAVAEQILGRLPEDFESRPTLKRLPFVAVALPYAMLTSPRAVRALHERTERWWSTEIARSSHLDLGEARTQWRTAEDRFVEAMSIHTTCVLSTIQPLYDAIGRVCTTAGRPELTQPLLAGLGNHAEVDVVDDLWAVSRGRLRLDQFLSRHGYHGHDEGEIASHVWRENPTAVTSLVEQYREKADGDGPEAVLAGRAREREAAEAELSAALPRATRRPVKLLLAAARRVVPLRGVGKVSYLQCVDVARAASRRAGGLLAGQGVIDRIDDVYLLTAEEMLSAGSGSRLQETVAARREQRGHHLATIIPAAWRGRPEVTVAVSEDRERAGMKLRGIGASGGVAQARVRVVLDAGNDEIEPDEILVAPYTDPSWGPIMFAAAGLVVDIGGELSHAAVVARELGIPCVMSTGDGTRRLRDGDICRVDGDAGLVEVIEAARP
jgi:pyruvate, water dikinase